MDAVQWIEYLNEQGTIVAEALVGNKAAEDAFKALMREAETQISDRDKEIRRLDARETELLINRRVLIERAQGRVPDRENETPPGFDERRCERE